MNQECRTIIMYRNYKIYHNVTLQKSFECLIRKNYVPEEYYFFSSNICPVSSDIQKVVAYRHSVMKMLLPLAKKYDILFLIVTPFSPNRPTGPVRSISCNVCPFVCVFLSPFHAFSNHRPSGPMLSIS